MGNKIETAQHVVKNEVCILVAKNVLNDSPARNSTCGVCVGRR
jgi:hypothetical protein